MIIKTKDTVSCISVIIKNYKISNLFILSANLLSFICIFNFCLINLAKAVEVSIIDCKKISENDISASFLNQKLAKKNLHYLIEAIYYGIDSNEIEKFISSETMVKTLIGDIKNDILTVKTIINKASANLTNKLQYLDENGKNSDIAPINNELNKIYKSLKSLVTKIDENMNNIRTQKELYNQLTECLILTQQEIEIIRSKRKNNNKINSSIGGEYKDKAVIDFLAAIRNIDEIIKDIQITFKPVEEFMKNVLNLFEHLSGMSKNFDASYLKVTTLLESMSSISGKITPPIYENSVKDQIPQIKILNKKIEKSGTTIIDCLEKASLDRNLKFNPKLKEANYLTYNDLSDSVIDIFSEWHNFNEILKKIYNKSYSIKIKDAFIKLKNTYRFKDEFGDECILVPGEYQVKRYEIPGAYTEEGVTLANDDIECEITLNDFNKIIIQR